MDATEPPDPESPPVSPEDAAVGRHILDARKALGLSHERLARMVGVSRITVLRWEQGKQRIMADNLMKLCRALGETPESLFGEQVFQARQEEAARPRNVASSPGRGAEEGAGLAEEDLRRLVYALQENVSGLQKRVDRLEADLQSARDAGQGGREAAGRRDA